ncbi:hypothetical protein JCM21714_1432 [Gracilibacillus boraciitolerans JCM 21714]|uniref:Uncharacterized protein n=1 Tax=Gracilibacillus boraciitolerans JCM 21714 TaxID=1298598 RepID=W4VH13_9BACI|nr:hypothetical protein [Gracilibacillus boraciitolerans]GAE92431.1 hypothetical protein JCM21714_1432 [Gracilibacillus boraciitolerans JCM 21714]
MKIIWLAVSLIPVPFLIHYYEIFQFPNRASFLFIETLLYVILAGLLSAKIEFLFIVLISIINIFISVVLGTQFIIPPNDSWFNPFGINVAIILMVLLF